MHQKIGKKIRLFFYSLLIIVLTSITNQNVNFKNVFNIKYIYVEGLTKEKNILIKSEIKKILEKNIFFISKDYFVNIIERNDTKYLSIKKNFPNKLIISITPAKPICLIEIKNNNFILGNNGKILDTKINKNNLPIISGSKNIGIIFEVVSLLNKSNLDYSAINKVIFFKSGRFDINLRDGIVIKLPIKFNKEIIDYSSQLLKEKNFANSKIIDLRIKNKIIINEQL